MPRQYDDDDDFEERPRRRRREREDDDEHDPPPRRKKSGSNLGLILGIVAGVLFLFCAGGGALIYFVSRGVGDAANRVQSTNDARQIAMACHNYEAVNGAFPTNSYSPDGKPLLSWRVHILPYMEQNNLYSRFRLDEPWNSPNNIRLLDSMPAIYAPVAEQNAGRTTRKTTFYRGFSNTGTLFARPGGNNEPALNNPLAVRNPKGVSVARIPDGSSNTIIFLEAGEPIEWTKPDDLDASPGKPFPTLGGARPKADTIVVAFADGSVRLLKRSNSEQNWRAATTIKGGEAVRLD